MLENLETQGYHLQMPPAEDEHIEHAIPLLVNHLK